ncbi:MAG: NADPH-dependent F420 reductase [Alphaproteobacteria bacterium]|jgi:hypothetical protein|nr:NADPH-dependent F420 reductase [Alphaproteobacteria bacterium]MDP6517718.1 NADPH-dependent F420 reductase [Alphaproteobacteria bacterium]
MTPDKPTLAVLGGTGAQGRGLALRWAKAGYPVILGTRSPEKGARIAAGFNPGLSGPAIRSMDNAAAAAEADIVVLTVPFAAQLATIEEVRPALAGKLLIDVTVPLVPPKVSRVQLPPRGSAVVAVQDLLGETVKVVSAFQNLSAHHLENPDHAVDCDVLVCGDDPSAREIVIGLARDAGLRALHAGRLANSTATESLTALLIAINRRYKVAGAGIRITGLAEGAEA